MIKMKAVMPTLKLKMFTNEVTLLRHRMRRVMVRKDLNIVVVIQLAALESTLRIRPKEISGLIHQKSMPGKR